MYMLFNNFLWQSMLWDFIVKIEIASWKGGFNFVHSQSYTYWSFEVWIKKVKIQFLFGVTWIVIIWHHLRFYNDGDLAMFISVTLPALSVGNEMRLLSCGWRGMLRHYDTIIISKRQKVRDLIFGRHNLFNPSPLQRTGFHNNNKKKRMMKLA